MNPFDAIATSTKSIVVGNNLIVVGDDTWQVRNLTGLSRREIPLTTDAPEPMFTQKRPAGLLILPILYIWTMIGIVLALYFNSNAPLWIGITIGIIGGWKGKSSEKTIWEREKSNFEKLHTAWKQLKSKRFKVYALSIETSAGSRPVFYSFDKEGIACVVKAVKDEMVNAVAKPITYTINTLNLSNDTNVINIGNQIYKQINASFKREAKRESN